MVARTISRSPAPTIAPLLALVPYFMRSGGGGCCPPCKRPLEILLTFEKEGRVTVQAKIAVATARRIPNESSIPFVVLER